MIDHLSKYIMNTLLSTHELLEQISQSIATASSNTVTTVYAKGWSSGIQEPYTTLGAIQHEHIHLLSADTQLQISSSDSDDTGITIFIKGIDSNFASVGETVVTHATNGRTPVTLTNSYFRILRMQVIAPSEPEGDTYLTIDGASLSNGKPDSQTDYIYSMQRCDNIGAILSGTVAPGEGMYLFPNYVIYSVTNDVNERSHFKFQMKKCSSDIWLTEFNFYVDERTNTQFTWRLDGIPPIPNFTDGMDFRVIASKVTSGGGTLNASGAVSIKTMYL